jgi:hypothetical protein
MTPKASSPAALLMFFVAALVAVLIAKAVVFNYPKAAGVL